MSTVPFAFSLAILPEFYVRPDVLRGLDLLGVNLVLTLLIQFILVLPKARKSPILSCANSLEFSRTCFDQCRLVVGRYFRSLDEKLGQLVATCFSNHRLKTVGRGPVLRSKAFSSTRLTGSDGATQVLECGFTLALCDIDVEVGGRGR